MHDGLPALKCSLRAPCCSSATSAPRPMSAGEAQTREGRKGRGMCPGDTICMHGHWGLGHKSSSTASPACCGLAARHRARESQPVSHSASTNVDSAKPKLWPSAFAEHGAWDCGCIFSTHTLSWSLTGTFMQNSFAGFLILCRQNNVSAGIALLSERSNHLQQCFQSEGLQGRLRALQSQRGCLKERPLDLAPKPVKHFKYVT